MEAVRRVESDHFGGFEFCSGCVEVTGKNRLRIHSCHLLYENFTSEFFPSVIFFPFFFFCLWTLRLPKSYPSLLPQLGTFSGNVSSSFMVFSCIVKIRKLLLPFIPAPFSDFIIQGDCCDRSASSFIFYHVRLRFVLFPFLSSLSIFGFPSFTRWIINSISVTSTLLFSFFIFTTINGWSL